MGGQSNMGGSSTPNDLSQLFMGNQAPSVPQLPTIQAPTNPGLPNIPAPPQPMPQPVQQPQRQPFMPEPLQGVDAMRGFSMNNAMQGMRSQFQPQPMPQPAPAQSRYPSPAQLFAQALNERARSRS